MIWGILILLLIIPMPIRAADYVLDWKDNADTEAGQIILQRIGPGNAEWNVLVVVQPNVTTWKVTIPDDNTRYCWRIVVFSQDGGVAEPSNTACARSG